MEILAGESLIEGLLVPEPVDEQYSSNRWPCAYGRCYGWCGGGGTGTMMIATPAVSEHERERSVLTNSVEYIAISLLLLVGIRLLMSEKWTALR